MISIHSSIVWFFILHQWSKNSSGTRSFNLENKMTLDDLQKLASFSSRGKGRDDYPCNKEELQQAILQLVLECPEFNYPCSVIPIAFHTFWVSEHNQWQKQKRIHSKTSKTSKCNNEESIKAKEHHSSSDRQRRRVSLWPENL
jgi:hypothetical protein